MGRLNACMGRQREREREWKLGSTSMNLSEHCHLKIQKEIIYFPLNVKFVCSGLISFLFLDICVGKRVPICFQCLEVLKETSLVEIIPPRGDIIVPSF